jgi:WD40 repeat protein
MRHAFKRLRRLVPVAVAVAVVAVGGTEHARAAFPGVNGKLAFGSNRDGNFEIYVMNADGSGVTRLTNDAASDGAPAWSPDSSKLAFASDRDGNIEIYVMNADGSGVARLTDNAAFDSQPAWSPDGSKLAFASGRDGNEEIYVMNADGSGQTNLTNNAALDDSPAWSPDGSKLAFTSRRDGNTEIYVTNADGSGTATRLTNSTPFGNVDPDWSPDGSKLAFVSSRDGNEEIYVMNADGSGQVRLTNNSLPDRDPAWSPDGSKIAFDNSDGEIYVMNADGSGRTNLTNDAAAADTYPAWQMDLAPTTTITLSPASPDGSNGWYKSPVGVSISASDPDGTVAQTRCALDPASTPAGFDDLPDASCTLSSVAIDGHHTLYAASVDANGNEEAAPVSASFKIDATNPVLSPTLSAPVVTIGQTGVTASPNATDATSGVATQSCGAIDTSSAGDHTAQCTATDNAGNTVSTTLHYLVEYRILGFFSPVPNSKWKLGQTVPVKVALANGDGTRISDTEAAELARTCRVAFSAAGAQTKSADCMKYDATAHQFVYNWKLGKSGTGAETITVSVSYSGTTTKTTISEPMTITT